MISLVFEAPGVVALRSRATRDPEQGEVIAQVLAAGICGSEIEAYRGTSVKRVPPLVLGHEAVLEWAGRRYVLNPLISCGVCRTCRAGAVNLCTRRRLFSLDLDGAHAAEMTVPESALIPIPDALSSIVGALAEPLATAVNAVRRPANGHSPESVAIIGCGSLGLLAVQAAWATGAHRVVATDRVPARRALAESFGAEAFVDLPDDSEFDLVVDMVGSADTRSAALRHAGPGATVRLVGLMSATSELPFGLMIARGVRMEGIYAYTPAQLQTAIELLSDGTVAPEPLITTRPLASGPAAFAELVDSPEALVKVVLVP